MPKRIQRKRIRGWRKPDGVVDVTRISRWGNKFLVKGKAHPTSDGGRETHHDEYNVICETAEEAVEMFRDFMERSPHRVTAIQRELKGKDLMCWCALDQPCHADVLLEIANRETGR